MSSGRNSPLPEELEERNHLTPQESYLLGYEIVQIQLSLIQREPAGEYGDNGVIDGLHLLEQIVRTGDVSESVANQISYIRQDLENKYGSDDLINQEDTHKVISRLSRWNGILIEELKYQKSLPIDGDGSLNTKELVDHPEKLFKPEVWDWLDDFAKEDIREACTALGVNCPTASVTVSLRTVEYYLRRWYESKTGEALEQSWGRVLYALEDEYPSDSDRPAVLTYLDYLRDRRNDIAHPNESPSKIEAERTLSRAQTTISEIYEVMKAESETPEKPN